MYPHSHGTYLIDTIGGNPSLSRDRGLVGVDLGCGDRRPPDRCAALDDNCDDQRNPDIKLAIATLTQDVGKPHMIGQMERWHTDDLRAIVSGKAMQEEFEV